MRELDDQIRILLECFKEKKKIELEIISKIHKILNYVSAKTTKQFINEEIPKEPREEMMKATRRYIDTLSGDEKLIFLIGKSYGNTETLIKIIHGD